MRYGQYFVILLCFYIYEFSFLFPLFQVNTLLRVSIGQKAGVLHKTFLALVSKSLSSWKNLRSLWRKKNGEGDFQVEVECTGKVRWKVSLLQSFRYMGLDTKS